MVRAGPLPVHRLTVMAVFNPWSRMAGHPMTSGGSVRKFNQAQWMSFGDYQQNYTDLHERILASRSFNKPIVNSEYGYYLRDSSGDGKVDKHNSFGPEDMRFATWDILMAGGYPVTGYGTTYMGGYRDPGPFNPDDPRNDIWAQHYRLAQRFLPALTGGPWSPWMRPSRIRSHAPRIAGKGYAWVRQARARFDDRRWPPIGCWPIRAVATWSMPVVSQRHSP